MTNLPDLARALYPRQHRCSACNVALTEPSRGMFKDGSGSEWCHDGLTRHEAREVLPAAPVILPSPILRWVVR
jgi:hypothetical protein